MNVRCAIDRSFSSALAEVAAEAELRARLAWRGAIRLRAFSMRRATCKLADHLIAAAGPSLLRP